MNLSSVKTTVNGKDGANFRRGMGVDTPVLKLLPKGTALEVFPDALGYVQGYTWVLAFYGGVYGFIVKSLLQIGQPEPKPPDPKPSDRRLYVGLHFAYNGGLGNSLSIIEEMAKGGYPIPGALVVSDPGLCRTLKSIDPNMIVTYRWVADENDQPPMTAAENSRPPNGKWWYDQLFLRHSQAAPYADLHQLHNEVTFLGNSQSVEYAKRFNQFCMEMMQAATADGTHVTFGNFNPGVPEQKHIDAMAESFTYAEAHGHWLCYHPYTSTQNDYSYYSWDTDKETGQKVLSTPYYGLRPAQWLLPYPRLNVIGGEAAHYHSPRYRGVEDFIKLHTEMHNMVAPHNVLRRWLMMYWTLRGMDSPLWTGDDFTEALPAFAANSKKLAGL